MQTPPTLAFGPDTDFDRLVLELQPDAAQTRQALARFATVSQLLKHNCGLEVSDVILGGSTAKGTSMRTKLEIDMVFLLADYDIENVPDYLNRLEKCVADNLKILLERKCRYSITFVYEGVQVDVLPGGLGTTPKTFLALSAEQSAFWAPSITQLQRDFIASKPEQYKNLVRLAKHWRDEGLSRGDLSRAGRPTSYLLELLALAAYEMLPQQQRTGSLRSCFIGLVQFLVDFAEANQARRLVWYHYYDESAISQAVRCRRLPQSGASVVDPANPTNDLWTTLRDPSALRSYARQTLATICDSGSSAAASAITHPEASGGVFLLADLAQYLPLNWHYSEQALSRTKVAKQCGTLAVKMRFTCSECARRWSTMKGVIEYSLWQGRSRTVCHVVAYGQACKVCFPLRLSGDGTAGDTDPDYQPPNVYADELARIGLFLEEKWTMPATAQARPMRQGAPRKGHSAFGCAACKAGKCKATK